MHLDIVMNTDDRFSKDMFLDDPQLTVRVRSLVENIQHTSDRSMLVAEAFGLIRGLPFDTAVLIEDELIEAGFEPVELYTSCNAQPGNQREIAPETRAGLPENHLLRELYLEHDLILGNVDDLDRANELVQNSSDFNDVGLLAAELQTIAENLLAAAPHHRREEDLLFPVVERHGLMGPPRAMAKAHVELDYRKMRLHQLCAHAPQMSFQQFRRQLNSTARILSLAIRDHIFKENNILYPAALEFVQSEEIWDDLACKSAEIGICDFWPRSIEAT